MNGALSLFGDAYEPADPPTADACPACAGPTVRGRECPRCRAAGITAARLDLAGSAAPAHAASLAADDLAEPLTPHALATWPHGPDPIGNLMTDHTPTVDPLELRYAATVRAAVRILERHAAQARAAADDRTSLAAAADTASQADRYYAQADQDRAAANAYADAARLAAAILTTPTR